MRFKEQGNPKVNHPDCSQCLEENYMAAIFFPISREGILLFSSNGISVPLEVIVFICSKYLELGESEGEKKSGKSSFFSPNFLCDDSEDNIA